MSFDLLSHFLSICCEPGLIAVTLNGVDWLGTSQKRHSPKKRQKRRGCVSKSFNMVVCKSVEHDSMGGLARVKFM